MHRRQHVVDVTVGGNPHPASSRLGPLLMASWWLPRTCGHQVAAIGVTFVHRRWLQYSTVRRIPLQYWRSRSAGPQFGEQVESQRTRHTLPVRSPLPNRQPSIRSAPAAKPNSWRRRFRGHCAGAGGSWDDRPRLARLVAHPLDRVWRRHWASSSPHRGSRLKMITRCRLCRTPVWRGPSSRRCRTVVTESPLRARITACSR